MVQQQAVQVVLVLFMLWRTFDMSMEPIDEAVWSMTDEEYAIWLESQLGGHNGS